jgi:cytochrome P450
LLGRGILTTEGPDWKWQRQAAAPMFRAAELATFVPAFVRAAEKRVESWRASNGPLAMDAEMTRGTFDVVADTLLRSSDASIAPAIHESMATLQELGGWDLLIAAMRWPRWLPRPGMFAEVRAMKRLRQKTREFVRKRREEGADDLVQRLMAARDPETGQAMDDEKLVDNVLTFYLAGHETTAKALTWTLYLLARSPEWTAALQEEAERVIGPGPLDAEHLDRLALTQQVLKEAMRLYPPVPIMSRQCVADVTIDGRAVASGTSLLMPIYAIHRHEALWPHPDAFMPERFAPAAEEALPRYQYMPFGAGPRVCIGRTFAMMEATAMLATFMRRATFLPVRGHEPFPIARVTLIPQGGMPLEVRLRT